MNISLLRRTQESIADETKKFDWVDWDHCIFGHALRLEGKTFDEVGLQGVLDILGLNAFEMDMLAFGYMRHVKDRRQAAIQIIDKLIQEHLQFAELDRERELVGV